MVNNDGLLCTKFLPNKLISGQYKMYINFSTEKIAYTYKLSIDNGSKLFELQNRESNSDNLEETLKASINEPQNYIDSSKYMIGKTIEESNNIDNKNSLISSSYVGGDGPDIHQTKPPIDDPGIDIPYLPTPEPSDNTNPSAEDGTTYINENTAFLEEPLIDPIEVTPTLKDIEPIKGSITFGSNNSYPCLSLQANSGLTAIAEIKNTGNTIEKATLILCEYEEMASESNSSGTPCSKFIGYNLSETKDVTPGTQLTLTTSLDIKTTQNHYIKAFVWDSLQGGKPHLLSATLTPTEKQWLEIDETNEETNENRTVYVSGMTEEADNDEDTNSTFMVSKGEGDSVWGVYEVNELGKKQLGTAISFSPDGFFCYEPFTNPIACVKSNENTTTEYPKNMCTIGGTRGKKIFNSAYFKNNILSKAYECLSFNPALMDSEDLKYLRVGIADSMDDNLTFGLFKYFFKIKDIDLYKYKQNYYYRKGRMITDSIFIATFLIKAKGSAAAAIASLEASGAAGAFAVATAPTGVGAIAGGGAAIGTLAASGYFALTSALYTFMASHSTKELAKDVNAFAKLKSAKLDVLLKNYETKEFTIQIKGNRIQTKVFKLPKERMKHILGKHHILYSPYKDGELVGGIPCTIFSKEDISIEEIFEVINDGLEKNKHSIFSTIDNGAYQTFMHEYIIKGKLYKFKIGYQKIENIPTVVQFYELKKGINY